MGFCWLPHSASSLYMIQRTILTYSTASGRHSYHKVQELFNWFYQMREAMEPIPFRQASLEMTQQLWTTPFTSRRSITVILMNWHLLQIPHFYTPVFFLNPNTSIFWELVDLLINRPDSGFHTFSFQFSFHIIISLVNSFIIQWIHQTNKPNKIAVYV